MHIDPNGWWFTLPALAGLLWSYLQPSDHAIKLFWRHLIQMDGQALSTVPGLGAAADEERTLRSYRRLFWLVVVALLVGSVGSIGAYLGLLPSQ